MTPTIMTAELAVRDLVKQLVAAWNNGDWVRFSQFFAEDAEYVSAAGLRLSGRHHIGAHLSSSNGHGPPQDKVLLEIVSLKLLAPEIVLALCSWQAGANRETTERHLARGGVITVVTRGASDRWHVVALHNTHRAS